MTAQNQVRKPTKKKYASASSGVPLEIRNQRYLIAGAIAGVLVIIATAGLYYFSRGLEKIDTNQEIAQETNLNFDETTTVITDSTQSGVQKLLLKEAKVEVLNGSGVSGLAGDTALKLEDLGYVDVSAGNADSTEKTKIIVSKNYSEEQVADILDDIKQIVKTGDIDSFQELDADIRIVLGKDQPG